MVSIDLCVTSAATPVPIAMVDVDVMRVTKAVKALIRKFEGFATLLCWLIVATNKASAFIFISFLSYWSTVSTNTTMQ